MITVFEDLGLEGVTPIVLSDAGHVIVHLAPYPIVARVAKVLDGDDPNCRREISAREVRISQHLSARGVPVVPCSRIVPPGPHQVAGTWMTLWEYMEPVSLPWLDGEQALKLVSDLVSAMSDFSESLPPLRVWRNVIRASAYLRSIKNDDRISRLLSAYEPVNERIQSESLYPAHGDAHQGNVIATAKGWRWVDFEDVSLMPKFWDLASFIGNTALFHGLQHPVVHSVLQSLSAQDRPSFEFALTARIIMGPMTNLAMALEGYGDLEFAEAQLDRANEFLDFFSETGSLWD